MAKVQQAQRAYNRLPERKKLAVRFGNRIIFLKEKVERGLQKTEALLAERRYLEAESEVESMIGAINLIRRL